VLLVAALSSSIQSLAKGSFGRYKGKISGPKEGHFIRKMKELLTKGRKLDLI